MINWFSLSIYALFLLSLTSLSWPSQSSLSIDINMSIYALFHPVLTYSLSMSVISLLSVNRYECVNICTVSPQPDLPLIGKVSPLRSFCQYISISQMINWFSLSIYAQFLPSLTSLSSAKSVLSALSVKSDSGLGSLRSGER